MNLATPRPRKAQVFQPPSSPPAPAESALDRTLGVLVTLGLVIFAASVPLSIVGAQIGFYLALGASLALVARRKVHLWALPLLWPFLAFVLVALVSIAAGGAERGWSPATAWRNGLAFFAVVLGLRVGGEREREARVGLMLLVAFSAAVVAVAVGVVEVFRPLDPMHLLGLHAVPYTVPAPDAPGLNAALGFFNSRLTFGHVLGTLLALALGLGASGALAGGGRMAWTALVGVLLVGIAATFSRSAYLGSAAAAFTVVAAAAVVRPRLALRMGAALLVVGALATAVWPGMRARLQSAVDPSRNPERVFVWERAAEVMADHPWLGVGFGNYPVAARPYYQRADPDFPMHTWAHNAALTALVEGGPLLLVTLVWLLVAAALAALRRLRATRPGSAEHGLAVGALGALALATVAALFHDLLYDGEAVFALSLALGLGVGGVTSSAPPAASTDTSARSSRSRVPAVRTGPAGPGPGTP